MLRSSRSREDTVVRANTVVHTALSRRVISRAKMVVHTVFPSQYNAK